MLLMYEMFSCIHETPFFPEDNQMRFPKMCIQVLSSSSVLEVLYEVETTLKDFSSSNSERAERWNCDGDVAICLQRLPGMRRSVLTATPKFLLSGAHSTETMWPSLWLCQIGHSNVMLSYYLKNCAGALTYSQS